jgi:hypothetical protein
VARCHPSRRVARGASLSHVAPRAALAARTQRKARPVERYEPALHVRGRRTTANRRAGPEGPFGVVLSPHRQRCRSAGGETVGAAGPVMHSERRSWLQPPSNLGLVQRKWTVAVRPGYVRRQFCSTRTESAAVLNLGPPQYARCEGMPAACHWRTVHCLPTEIHTPLPHHAALNLSPHPSRLIGQPCQLPGPGPLPSHASQRRVVLESWSTETSVSFPARARL